VAAAKLDQGNVSQEAAKLIVLELFREGAVSLGRAVELCATPLAAFMEFAAKHGVPPLNYGIEELEEDRRTWSSYASDCCFGLLAAYHAVENRPPGTLS